jgi:hypothetical protein
MHRKRGLVSQANQAMAPRHALADKRVRASSDADPLSELSESSDLSSGLLDLGAEIRAARPVSTQVDETDAPKSGPIEITDHPESPRSKTKAKRVNAPKRKEKVEITDDTRWQKMKIKGSDKEMLVDLTRVQKYVDLDSAGVKQVHDEVAQAKGNFRQHVVDYSDL